METAHTHDITRREFVLQTNSSHHCEIGRKTYGLYMYLTANDNTRNSQSA
jgi:hypothetical protein